MSEFTSTDEWLVYRLEHAEAVVRAHELAETVRQALGDHAPPRRQGDEVIPGCTYCQGATAATNALERLAADGEDVRIAANAPQRASCFLHGEFDAALLRCPKCGAGRGSDTTGAAARNSRPTPEELAGMLSDAFADRNVDVFDAVLTELLARAT